MINFAVMKSSLSHILESIKEANELLEQGAIDDAVMLSGEALAKAYENWSANLNYQQPTTNEIKLNAMNAIADNPPASPSSPSVRFTAFDPPTKTKRIASPYSHPNSISIPSVPTTQAVCPPFLM